MTDNDFTELAARCEALSRLTLHMAAQLEDRGIIDGHQLQEGLLARLPHGSPMLDRSAVLIGELVSAYSGARATRRTRTLRSANRGNRHGCA